MAMIPVTTEKNVLEMNSLFERKRREIRFEVLGTPRPQGSNRGFVHRHTGRVVITSDNKRLLPWRQQVAGTAMALSVDPFADGVPVEIALNFYFSRPKSAKRRIGMTVKPDIDKTIRAILDALKGILIHDDAQIVELHARKHYGGPERVEIVIQEAI
jgi:Holliday junction resolvase RusA-like endonuclease